MSSDLKNSCFNNLVDFWKSLAKNEAAGCVDTDDYIFIKTGLTAPLFNPVFLKETAKELPGSEMSACHSVWYDSDRNQSIKLKNISNLEIILDRVPMMSINLNKNFKQDVSLQAAINIVENGSDLKNWMEPIQIAFGMDDDMTLSYRRGLEYSPEKFIHFVANIGDKIIGSASLFLHPEIAGLYNLAVLPEYRKQGIATALHYARLNEARKRGYEYATLQATPMATSLDSSIGFKTLSEISIYKAG